MFQCLGLQTVGAELAGVAALKPHRRHGHAQPMQGPRGVVALAARIQPRHTHAIGFVRMQPRHMQRAVNGGVGGDGHDAHPSPPGPVSQPPTADGRERGRFSIPALIHFEGTPLPRALFARGRGAGGEGRSLRINPPRRSRPRRRARRDTGGCCRRCRRSPRPRHSHAPSWCGSNTTSTAG